jgi:hypothetical protein
MNVRLLNMSTKYLQDGESYLQMYPKLRKWINQCVACNAIGYKPTMPEDIYPGIAAQNIRHLFSELALNDDGLCSICAQATRNDGEA